MRTTCPHCHSSAKITEEHLGKQVRCKKCGGTFRASCDPLDDVEGREASPTAGTAIEPQVDQGTPATKQASAPKQQLKRCDPACAAIASLLLPGLGQMAQGREEKGFSFFALWVSLMAGVILGGLVALSNRGSEALFFFLVTSVVMLVSVGVHLRAAIDAACFDSDSLTK